MADFLLNSNGDLDLTTGDIQIVTGIDAIAQNIKIRLQFVLGEWFLDELLGLDWYGEILVKTQDLPRINQIFREAILETPGVVGLESFSLSFDRARRNLRVQFRAVTDTEGIVEFDEELLIS